MACGGCNKGPSLFRKRNKDVDNKPSVVSRNNNNNISISEVSVNPKQSVIRNLIKAASSQPNAIKWFRDGVSGIIKCLEGNVLYTDSEISENRQVCQDCEFSTKNDKGKLTLSSQCMAPDPERGGAPCGCFIVCKTQSGSCPIHKWVHLTINKT